MEDNLHQYTAPKAPKVPIKKIKRISTIVALSLFALIIIFNGVYTINEQEQGVIVTLGKPTSIVNSGLNFKLPFIQQLHRIDTTIQGLPIGYNRNSGEYIDDESMMITSDFNFVNVDFYVEYKVSDPIAYLYNSQNPVDILKNVSQSCIRTVVGSYPVDSILTDGKTEIQANIKDMILKKLEEQDIGIQLINLSIQDAEPPTQEVMQAFKAVENAKQEKETIINNAKKYQNEKMPTAKADVDNILQEAKTTKTQRINEAQAQVALFNAMYKEYKKNPDMTKKRMFYEAMEAVLPDLEVIIDSGTGGVQKILPLDQFATVGTTKQNTQNPDNKQTKSNNKSKSESEDN